MFVTLRLHSRLHSKTLIMETSIIEKLDKSRYNLLKWFAVSWALWFGTFIIKGVLNNSIVIGVVVLIGLVGWILWTINLVNFYRLGKIVNADENLKRALNDELHQHNTNKSYAAGYSMTVLTIAIFIGIATFFKVSTLLAFEITLYVSVLSVLIASLIYSRN